MISRLLRSFRSISVRVTLVVFVAGTITAAVAILFAAQAMVTSSEAGLVDGAVDATERERDAVANRLATAEAELRAAAWALSAGHAVEISGMLSPVIVAAQARGDTESVEVARNAAGRHALAEALRDDPGPGHYVVDDGHDVLLVIDVDQTRVVALVEVESVLRAPDGGRAWIAQRGPRDAFLGTNSGVVAQRSEGVGTGEIVTTTVPIDESFVVRRQTPLAPARAQVAAVVEKAVTYAALAVVLLLVLAWVLGRSVTRPVLALAAAVRQSDHAKAVFPELPNDEIGELGAAIVKMRDALGHDAEILRVGAKLARRVVQLRGPEALLAELESALAESQPAQRWHVVSVAQIDDGTWPPELAADLATLRAAVSAPLITSSPLEERRTRGDESGVRVQVMDDAARPRIVVGMSAGGRELGVAIGSGPASEADMRQVEILCRTIVAAARNLQLSDDAMINEKLAVLGRLSASVAHEMNNPLAYMLTNLSMLEERLEGEAREMAQDAKLGAERLANIVGDLSSLARGGSAALTRENLVELTRGQIKVATARGPATFAFDAPDDVPVMCNRGRIEQAILNLLANAVDAVRHVPEPRVSVSLARDGARALLMVGDNGPGIPPNVARRLFDAFFTTKGEKGTGLGLFLSRTFVQSSGGDLTLLSTGPEGTIFRIELPVVESTSVRRPIQSTPPAVRPRVLVIDDEEAIVRALERWLGSRAEFVGTTSPREGLRRAIAEKFSFVLCDLHMPEMDGSDFVTALRERGGNGTRVVLMTGSNDAGPPGVKLLRKPLRPSVLQELLDEA